MLAVVMRIKQQAAACAAVKSVVRSWRRWRQAFAMGVESCLSNFSRFVWCVVARQIEGVQREDRARQCREADVQVNTQLLPSRCVHVEVLVSFEL